MITAETAYNVVKALSLEEYPRLLKMMGVSGVTDLPKQKRKPLLSDSAATELLMKRLKKCK